MEVVAWELPQRLWHSVLEGPRRDSPLQVGMEEGQARVAEAGWRVLPSSRQQMAMSPCDNRRQGGIRQGCR